MIRLRPALRIALAATVFALPVVSQDHLEMGKMWTFEHVPKDYFREEHGFELTQEWLDQVRLASLRFGGGCSASFVSPRGLVMTNHHCARDYIASASPPDADWVRDGFVAASMEDEVKLQGLTVQQLVSMVDVTDRMNAGIVENDDDDAVNRKRTRNERDLLEEARQERPELTPQIVKLYQGGVFMLYAYKHFRDVRLVVAPHLQTAHFGGDPDNFTYPRYGIDFAFCRAYEDGRPVDSSAFHFGWDGGGADEGESVFITGNPGRTSRLLSKAQLEVLRDITYPVMLQGWEMEIADIHRRSLESPEVEKALRPRLLRLENSFKAVSGYLAGLRDAGLMRAKAAAEAELRTAVARQPELAARYGDAWDRLAEISRQLRTCEPVQRLYDRQGLGPIVERAALALQVNGDDAGNERVVKRILAMDVSLDPARKDYLAQRLEQARAWLGMADPLMSALASHGTMREALDALENDSLFARSDAVEALLAGGPEAIRASEDVALQLARILDTGLREAGEAYRRLKGEEEVQKVRVGQAAFAVYGFSISPDATFTLRLSDGKVAGFPCNGTIAPPSTCFYGLYARNVDFRNRHPFDLPQVWLDRRERIDMTRPVDFVATNDIIGGNSGSPVIDVERRVVGLVFDGNIEMLPNNFFYRDEIARSVSVHTAAIEECLEKIYDAQWVLAELQGR